MTRNAAVSPAAAFARVAPSSLMLACPQRGTRPYEIGAVPATGPCVERGPVNGGRSSTEPVSACDNVTAPIEEVRCPPSAAHSAELGTRKGSAGLEEGAKVDLVVLFLLEQVIDRSKEALLRGAGD